MQDADAAAGPGTAAGPDAGPLAGAAGCADAPAGPAAGAAAAPARPLPWRLLLAVGPPAGVLLLANGLWWAAAQVSHHNYPRSLLWVRYDSLHYLQIAGRGYTLVTCAGHSVHYGKGYWCGDAGWFPGYPALIWLLEHLGLSGPDAGVLLSSAFGLAMLTLLWNGFLGRRADARSVLALALAAFFAGQVYQRAVFPISMEIFFLLATVWLAARQRWLAAGLAGAAASFTYSTGFLAALAVAAWVLLDRTIPGRAKLTAIALSGGLTAAGLLAVLAVQFTDTGVWGAFFKVQKKYHYHGLHLPSGKFLATVSPLFRHRLSLTAAPAAETLVVAVFCVCLVVWAALRRRELVAAEHLVLSVTLWFWLFPLALGAGLDLYRSEALLVPSVVLARRLPLPLQAMFLVAMVALAFAMSVLFFRRVLI